MKKILFVSGSYSFVHLSHHYRHKSSSTQTPVPSRVHALHMLLTGLTPTATPPTKHVLNTIPPLSNKIYVKIHYTTKTQAAYFEFSSTKFVVGLIHKLTLSVYWLVKCIQQKENNIQMAKNIFSKVHREKEREE